MQNEDKFFNSLITTWQSIKVALEYGLPCTEEERGGSYMFQDIQDAIWSFFMLMYKNNKIQLNRLLILQILGICGGLKRSVRLGKCYTSR